MPDLTSNVTITGPGANSLTVQRDTSAPDFRIFTTNTNISVTISGLTISKGTAATGGGILNGGTGTLNLDGCILSTNGAGAQGNIGGGLANAGTANLNNCTFTDNNSGRAGAINNSGTLTIANCTFNNNNAFTNISSATTLGGAIYSSGSLSVTNSTLYSNGASNGGGLYNTGTADVLNCTISSNRAIFNLNGGGTGGAIYNSGGTVNLTNSIAHTTIGTNVFGTLNTNDHNLVGVDAKLGPLQNNGGSTQTMALLTDSPAIDAGTNTGAPATDQRGVARPQNATVDIGAYELRANATISGTIRNTNAVAIAGVSVQLSSGGGAVGPPVTTDTNGFYQFTGVDFGTYTITSTRATYAFLPATRSVTVTAFNAAVSNQNFTGYNATLNGRVAFSNGVGIAGVEVRLNIGRSVLTNGAGYYTFTGMLNGAYTVTPVLAGYSFDPALRPVTINNASVANINFTGGFAINGRIANSQGTGLPGLRVYRTGSSVAAVTNSAGYFAFYGVTNGTYILTPDTTQGYGYTPQTRSLTINGATVNNQNFIGTSGFSVSGRIATSNGTGISGVTVTRTGSATPVVTNSAGYYTFYGVTNGTYTLTPSKSGYTFTPVTKNVTVSGTNVGNQNITGTGS